MNKVVGRQPFYVNYLKWSQMTICILTIVVGASFIFTSPIIANRSLQVWREEAKSILNNKTDWRIARIAAIVVSVIIGLMMIGISVMGLLAAIRRNFFLSLTYSIVLTFDSIMSCATILKSVDTLVWTLTSIVFCAISWMFALSINTDNDDEDNEEREEEEYGQEKMARSGKLDKIINLNKAAQVSKMNPKTDP